MTLPAAPTAAPVTTLPPTTAPVTAPAPPPRRACSGTVSPQAASPRREIAEIVKTILGCFLCSFRVSCIGVPLLLSAHFDPRHKSADRALRQSGPVCTLGNQRTAAQQGKGNGNDIWSKPLGNGPPLPSEPCHCVKRAPNPNRSAAPYRRGFAHFRTHCANSCRSGRGSFVQTLENFGKIRPRLRNVEHQKRLVTFRVEWVLCGLYFTAQKPTQASGIKVAAFEWLFSETLPQGAQKTGIGALVGGTSIAVALSRHQRRGTLGIGATYGELEIRTRQTSGKTAMFQH